MQSKDQQAFQTNPQQLGESVIESLAQRSISLFKPDFSVYADRGSNCVDWETDADSSQTDQS